MADTIKNTSTLLSETNTTIFPNTTGQIDASAHQQHFRDTLVSFINRVTDAGLLGLKEYATGTSYSSGDTCIYDNGGGDKLYMANQSTSGAFTLAHWDEVTLTAGNVYSQDGQITSNRSVLATASENFSLGFSATPAEVFNLLQLGGTNVSIYGLSAGLPTGFFAITPTTTEINSDVATGTTLISGNNITATATSTNQIVGNVVAFNSTTNLTALAQDDVTVTAQNGAITLQDNAGANYLYIDGTGFDLFGTDVGGTGDTIQVTGFAGDFDVAADNRFSLTSSDSATTSSISAQGGLTLQSTDLDLTIQNTGSGDMNFDVGSGSMLVSGSGSFEGFKYVADIRANLVDKSLVPKDYVDARFDVLASSASYTPDADSNDGTTLTALATNLTINAPTGTPKEGQTYVIKIKDDGTSRTLTWDAIYQDNWAGGTINTLRTSTTVNKWHRFEFEYNSTDAKWDVISIREKV